MTVTGLGTYCSASRSGQGKNHFSTAGQQETCTNSEQWALWSLRSDVSCGNLADLQAATVTSVSLKLYSVKGGFGQGQD